jgi:hypothetical protein
MNTTIRVLALMLVLFLVMTGATLAQGGVELRREVLSGGASHVTGGDVTLRATLGQPVVGLVVSGGEQVTFGQGFWHGVRYRNYLPVIQR